MTILGAKNGLLTKKMFSTVHPRKWVTDLILRTLPPLLGPNLQNGLLVDIRGFYPGFRFELGNSQRRILSPKKHFQPNLGTIQETYFGQYFSNIFENISNSLKQVSEINFSCTYMLFYNDVVYIMGLSILGAIWAIFYQTFHAPPLFLTKVQKMQMESG